MHGRSERTNAKIRDAQYMKTPYLLVVGDCEVENGKVSLRLRSGKNRRTEALEAFIGQARRQDFIKPLSNPGKGLGL